MIKVDLTKKTLFESFAEIKKNDAHIDLHNDFRCHAISFSNKEKKLVLKFKANRGYQNKIQNVHIVFNNAIIALLNFDMTDDEGYLTIDNMYRGRFLETENSLVEKSVNGLYYYYLNFYDDYSFEVLSDLVIAELS